MEDLYNVRDTYYYYEFPYISKSSYKMWKTCKYKFKRTIIDGVAQTPNRVMVKGTSLHYLFFKFFELVDFDFLYELDWSTHNGTVYSAVYQYFYSLFITYLGKIDEGKIQNTGFRMNLESFCMFEENLWSHIRISYQSKTKIRKHFMAGLNHREKFMFDHDMMIFGTIDRIMEEDGKTIIVDYKSGERVPKKLITEVRSDVYSSALPNHYIGEGNFYVLLYLYFKGYTVGTNEKGKTCIMKNGKECKGLLKKFDFAFVFTGYFIRGKPQYFVGRKKASIVSIKTLMKNLKKIREWKDWKREPALIRCKWCHLYKTECKGKIPIEIYGDLLRGETAPQESIYNTK